MKLGRSVLTGRSITGWLPLVMSIFLIAAFACSSSQPAPAPAAPAPAAPSAPAPAAPAAQLSGDIEIDGSSTVFPITEAVAEEFRKVNPGVQVNVGVSGTGSQEQRRSDQK